MTNGDSINMAVLQANETNGRRGTLFARWGIAATIAAGSWALLADGSELEATSNDDVNSVACYKYEGGNMNNVHGSLQDLDNDGKPGVVLNVFQPYWPGDFFYNLRVKGGTGTNQVLFPASGVEYEAPLNNGGNTADVSNWQVCKAERVIPTTTVLETTTTTYPDGTTTTTTIYQNGTTTTTTEFATTTSSSTPETTSSMPESTTTTTYPDGTTTTTTIYQNGTTTTSTTTPEGSTTTTTTTINLDGTTTTTTELANTTTTAASTSTSLAATTSMPNSSTLAPTTLGPKPDLKTPLPETGSNATGNILKSGLISIASGAILSLAAFARRQGTTVK